MAAEIIDGRACAHQLKETLKTEVLQLKSHGDTLGLATVIVGSEYGSVAYERRLARLTSELDVPYQPHRLPADATHTDVSRLMSQLNESSEVSGILVLRPLPSHIDEASVFQGIDPRKDIESVHPENAGLLALGVPRFVPSTAASVFHLLDTWIDSTGEKRSDFYHRSLIVVVGRSNNVGKPAISLGYDRQASVESVDEWADRTVGLGRHTRRADVLIVAAGRPGLIRAEHVSDHAVVLDVGINAAIDAEGVTRMVGDVDFASVEPRVRAITPVPGGVGPVTDVWLLHNTVSAAKMLAGSDSYSSQPAMEAL